MIHLVVVSSQASNISDILGHSQDQQMCGNNFEHPYLSSFLWGSHTTHSYHIWNAKWLTKRQPIQQLPLSLPSPNALAFCHVKNALEKVKKKFLRKEKYCRNMLHAGHVRTCKWVLLLPFIITSEHFTKLSTRSIYAPNIYAQVQKNSIVMYFTNIKIKLIY